MFLGRTFSELARDADAIGAYQRALSLNPENLESLAYMGESMASMGDHNGALKVLERVRATESRFEPALLIASIYAGLGAASEMFRWLQIAFERKSGPLYIVLRGKPFRPYQADPRYRSFVESLGLPRGAVAKLSHEYSG